MSEAFTVACVQHCADDKQDKNLDTLQRLIEAAAATGAKLVCLPETCGAMYPTTKINLEKARSEEHSEALKRLREVARDQQIWLAVGSLMLRVQSKSAATDKLANRSFVIDPSGAIVSRYDKIHLFDVSLAQGESYRESDYVEAGNEARAVQLPFATLGLSICYDLRFPHLYRYLALQGADCLLVPAAFTQTTGEAHWHSLLRARAIETGCYVIAAAQCGRRDWGRATYGHSLIIDPWGKILADAGRDEGFISATVDASVVAQARASIPSLHNKAFKAEF